MRLFSTLWCAAALAAAPFLQSAPDDATTRPASATGTAPLRLQPDDRIAILGNADADALLQDGHLETLLHLHFPTHRLFVRNLAFPGDTAQGRGIPTAREQWIKTVDPDVLLVFCGGADSFAGKQGLPSFRAELTALLKKTAAMQRQGKAPIRTVVVGPFATQPAQTRAETQTIPEGIEARAASQPDTDRRLYSEAAAAVAGAAGLPFVDLFSLTQDLLATGPQRSALLPARWGAPANALQTNTGYLTTEAHRLLAPKLFHALFGEVAPNLPPESSESSHPHQSLRASVVARQAEWQAFYRPLAGTPPPKDWARLEPLFALRDETVWALAKGAPPAAPAQTAPPPPSTNQESDASKLKIREGFTLHTFATHSRFPELVNPTQIGWDAQGRLGVLCRPQPQEGPLPTSADRLILLEDTDGDGEADRSSIFADHLNRAGAFTFHRDGILVEQAGDLWLLRDPNHTGRATEQERVLMGFGVAGAGPSPNRLQTDPKGAVYWADAGSHRSRIETRSGLLPEGRGTVLRFEPNNGRLETLLNSGTEEAPAALFAFWGDVLFTDSKAFFWHSGSTVYGRTEPLPKQANWPRLWEKLPAPCSGTALVRGSHFPAELHGALAASFLAKPARILLALPGEDSPSELLSSEDPAFRPRALAAAPDGSLYFADGPPQGGSIHRITAQDRPFPELPPLATASAEDLLDALKSPEESVREKARHRLGTLPAAPTLEAINTWVNRLNPADPQMERYRLEALWAVRWFGAVDVPLLEKALASPEPNIRAQGVRILCEARSLLPDAMRRLTLMATDAHERVRLEVLAAAGFFAGTETPAAVRLVHRVLLGTLDSTLERVAKETLRQLEPDPGRMLLPSEPAVLRFVLDRLTDAELAKATPAEPVWLAQLRRTGVPAATKEQALRSLAKKRNTSFVTELALTLEQLDAVDSDPALFPPLLELLTNQQPGDLASGPDALAKLAGSAKPGRLRKVAHASWIQSAPPTEIWTQLQKDTGRQIELLQSLALVHDKAVRAACHPFLASVIESDQNRDKPVFRAALAALPLTGEAFAGRNLELLSSVLLKGKLVPEAVQALAQLPQTTLRTAKLQSLFETLSAWMSTQTGPARNTPAFAQTLQLSRFLATAWEEEVHKTVEQFQKQTAPLLVIRTVCDQSRFDTPLLSVRAGQSFQLLFGNTDVRPQNLVLTLPGAAGKVLKEAAQIRGTPDTRDKQDVPSSPLVVAASKVLAPGDQETLKLKAPMQPGDYEYLSTASDQENAPRGVLRVLP